MTSLPRALAAVLILAVPFAASAATKPAPAKPVAKPAAKPTPKPATKPAAKPAPDKPTAAKPAPSKPAPAKPKAAAKKKGDDIDPRSHAEKDGFGILQVAAPDADKFIAAWKLGTGATSASTRTVANQPIFTFLIFRGCKANEQGNCDVVADFVIHRPDGTLNEDNKGILVWNKPAPADPKKPYLGEGSLAYAVDEEGPFGDYRVVATVTDRVAGVSVTTEQTLTIAPFLPVAPMK